MATLLIFLHGSGGNGRDLRDYLDFIPLDQLEQKTFGEIAGMAKMDIITPTASERPYTPMNSMSTRVWFDRSSNFMQLGCDDVEDTQGVNESLQQVLERF
jgi:predicted esterase